MSNQELIAKVRKHHDELNKLRDEAAEQGLKNVNAHLKEAGRSLDVIYEYDRAEAPER